MSPANQYAKAFRGLICPECGAPMRKRGPEDPGPVANRSRAYCALKGCNFSIPVVHDIKKEMSHGRKMAERRKRLHDELFKLEKRLGRTAGRADLKGLRQRDRKALERILEQRDGQIIGMEAEMAAEAEAGPEKRRAELLARLDAWHATKARDKKSCRKKNSYLWRSRAEAEKRRGKRERGVDLRVYRCLACCCFHLTSMERPEWLPDWMDE